VGDRVAPIASSVRAIPLICIDFRQTPRREFSTRTRRQIIVDKNLIPACLAVSSRIAGGDPVDNL